MLERVAALSKVDGFLGVWSLLSESEAAVAYRAAASHIKSHQTAQRGSHIHTVVTASLDAQFGHRGEHVWISPLASFYWFFSLEKVARENLLLPHIADTETLWEVAAIIEAQRRSLRIKPRSPIPL